MNAKLILSIAALAAAAATGAQAGELDAEQFHVKFEGQRTRAEVMAEAATIPATRSTEYAGSRVAPLPTSGLDSKVVRGEAIKAVRAGQTTHGEM